MHFVTLTTDWNKDDFYTGAIKGAILSACNDARVVTLSNRVKPFNVPEAAFIVRNSFRHFPEGSIHMVAVGSDPGPDGRLIASRIDGHYFLTGDNGIAGLLGDSGTPEAYLIDSENDENCSSFPELTCFSRVACRLILGETLDAIGQPAGNYKKQVPFRATFENDTIVGAVIYVDSFGNAHTNITQELFRRIGRDREFTIYAQSKHYKINKINRVYSETTPGDLLALFNSVGLLEIAIRNGSAGELLNLSTSSTVRVEFN